MIPHITNEIKDRFYRNPAAEHTEIAIIEVGGTVGDIESQPFLEAIRQFQHEKGHENVILIHVTLIPYLRAPQEMKTKPTQASVKDLQGMGIWPDILVCRSEYPLSIGIRDKIALFCNVEQDCVIQNATAETLYEVPLLMAKEGLDEVVCRKLGLITHQPDLREWRAMGGQIILTADAHSAEHLTYGYRQAVRLAREAGFTRSSLLTRKGVLACDL